MSKYAAGKEKARQIAIDWQQENSDYPYSYERLIIMQNYFYKLAKRYGLLTEFMENGIPCWMIQKTSKNGRFILVWYAVCIKYHSHTMRHINGLFL